MHKKPSVLNSISLICGTMSVVCLLICKIISGNPLEMIHKLNGFNIFPPIWIYNLLSIIWFFMIGLAAGAIIYECSIHRMNTAEELCACKGGLFFIASFFLSLIWQPVFFSLESIFLSLIVCFISIICSGICSGWWFKTTSKACATIIFAYTIWLVYIFIVNLSILFHN